MSERITGYVLLALGLILIFYSAVSVYQVFNGQFSPVQLFHLNSITYNPSNSQISLPPVELFPAPAFNQISNLTAHVILMGFLAGVGSKIAILGVQLLRPVNVKLNKYTLESDAK